MLGGVRHHHSQEAHGHKDRPPFSWNSALHYDARFGVVLLHNPIRVWALRLDRKAAKMAEAQE
ncbi:MAG TPA: hypothetical protein VNE39_10180 [Planctomycetota bacterium]|nr:hypothetical protein [Planctomycetota bacterium]